MLQFKDPTKLRTKKIVFEAAFSAEDSGTIEQLKELSSKRVNIESMNQNKSVPGPNAECEQDIQKLELYLPSLDNLVQHIDLLGCDDPRVIRSISNLKIRWTSPLSSTCSLNIMGPKFFQIDSLRFELGFVLFFYGSLRHERASQVLDTGVYQYLGHDVLPFIKAKLSPHGPPEATSSASSVMSLICLAEAQMVTIMKAEEKKTADGLLSKLHYGVVQLLDEATDFYSAAAKECKEISPGLMDYISCSKALHKLRGYKHMAESVKTEGQMGTAIGLLKQALNSKVQKNVGGLDSWRKVIKQDVNALTELLRRYEHENDFVWSEKVPCDEHLPLLQGKKIATCIPYCPAGWERTLKLKI